MTAIHQRLEHLVGEADRVVGAVLGLYFVYSGFWLYQIWQHEPSYVFFDFMWPWVYIAAGVASFVYAVVPWSARIAAFASTLMLGALLSRAASIVAAWSAGTDAALSTARTWFAFGTWVGFAFAVATLWVLLRTYGVDRRRIRKR